MKRIKKFFINTIILVFSSVLLRLIAMFFNIYITNKIGEEALGVFQLIMSVYLFAKTSIKKITSKCIFISFVTGILASLLLFLGANIAVKYCLHNLISKSVIYLICIALPFISMSSAITGYFMAIRKVYKNAIRKVFWTIN